MSLLDNVTIHPSWNEFLTDECKNELEIIEGKIGNDYTPSADKVLRFLSLDLNELKVVILGQDPYKPVGVATGRSFEPSNLNDWSDKFRQVSLKNIVRLIYKTYNQITEYDKIPNYSEIIKDNNFVIKSPHDWFDSLENQGVLFLNTTLTCKIGLSNSHKDIWSHFSSELLKYISTKRPDLYWFLWGKESISNSSYIYTENEDKYIIKSNHPMMCAEKYETDFLKSNCFEVTMDLINWMG